MSRYYRSPSYGSGYPVWSPAVRALIITCGIVFLLQLFDGQAHGSLTRNFGLSAYDVIHRLFLWQPVTYIFLHDRAPLHIFFNMVVLWMFGSDVERQWGSKEFLRFFFICGIGAGVVSLLVESLFPPAIPTLTIGASGAIYGVLLAYGLLFPDRVIYYLIFPIRARWLVVIVGALAFYSSFDRSSGVASVAHLGGMAIGFVYLKAGRLGDLRGRYGRWRRNRLRRNFEVYYNDRDREEPPKWRRWR